MARLPAAERREQLLDVALQSFGAAGFHATSMNHIAAAAGVTKPVLYQHFSSKTELFEQVVAAAGTKLRDAVDKALTAESTPARPGRGELSWAHRHPRHGRMDVPGSLRRQHPGPKPIPPGKSQQSNE